jgi:hypothetical protein
VCLSYSNPPSGGTLLIKLPGSTEQFVRQGFKHRLLPDWEKGSEKGSG